MFSKSAIQTRAFLLMLLAAGQGFVDASAVFMPDPSSLVAFWPLDRLHEFTDISGLKRPTSIHRGIINTMYQGPFGFNDTSLTVNTARGQGYLFESRFKAPSPSFSISFAFFAGDSDSGILTTATACNGLSLHYSATNPPALILSKFNFPAQLIAKFAVFKKKAWNFMTVTFDAMSNQLIVLGKDKMLAYSPYEPQIAQTIRFNSGLLAGFSCYDGHTNFKPDSALSCLAIHDRVLTLSESQQVFEACRSLHVRAAASKSKGELGHSHSNDNNADESLLEGKEP